jgi:hypothetical protein
VSEIELHDEVVDWMDSLDDREWNRTVVVIALASTARRITYRFTNDGRIVLLTTFRKQRNNERAEMDRARKAADDCARRNP